VHDLVEALLAGSCDVFMHEESPNLGFDNIVLLNPLNHSYVLPLFSLPFPSPEYDIAEPISDPMICDANNDWTMRITCLVYLVEVLMTMCP